MNNENQNSDFAGQFQSIYKRLNQESERGSAIIGAALIDDLLAEMLKTLMIASIQENDELFTDFAPLGSLSAKIAVSCRLGLISPSVRESLDFVRKIRNDFAHVSEQINFKAPSIHNKIRELFKLNKPLLDSIWEITKENIVELKSELDSTHGVDNLVKNIGWKSTYDVVISVIAASLCEYRKNIPKIKSIHRD